MAELSITNVVTVSVSAPQKGLSAYNVNNIALFTDETPEGSFADGYKIYKGISDVITDFGSDSKTVAMATNIFLQTPNMQNGNGYLVIIPLQAEETLAVAYARAKGLVDFAVLWRRKPLKMPMSWRPVLLLRLIENFTSLCIAQKRP